MNIKDLISRGKKIQKRKGTWPLIKESLRFCRKRLFRRVAPRSRTVGFICGRYLKLCDRKSLKSHAETVYPYSKSESITIEIPFNSSLNQNIPVELSHIGGVHSFEQPFVCHLKNAHILSHSGIITTSDHSIVLESVASKRYTLERYYLRNNQKLFQSLYRQYWQPNNTNDYDHDLAFSLITAPNPHSTAGYSGWTRFFLPRLEGLRVYEEQTGNGPKILVNPQPLDLHIESLKLLGYDSERIVRWDPSEELKIRRLVVPSVRKKEWLKPRYQWRLERTQNRWYNSVQPSALRWLRREATESVANLDFETEFSDRVYISRDDASKRRVVNEDNLMDELQKRGFVSYKLETLSFAEQVKLFSQAEKIVAPHGAGLANLTFASDCTIIELFGAKIRPTFYMLSEKLNLEYRFVLGEPRNDYTDIFVDPDSVKALLD